MGVVVKGSKRSSVDADQRADAATLQRFNVSTLQRFNVSIANRQRTRVIDLPLLRRILRTLLRDLIGARECALGIQLVAARELARLNEQFLGHKGSTDVITFDYGFGVLPSGGLGFDVRDHAAPDRLKAGLQTLQGEMFICVDAAVTQARQFRTTWQSELVRYVIHGLLHLIGHDDHRTAARKKMKREENRLLREIARRFDSAKLAKRRARKS